MVILPKKILEVFISLLKLKTYTRIWFVHCTLSGQIYSLGAMGPEFAVAPKNKIISKTRKYAKKKVSSYQLIYFLK